MGQEFAQALVVSWQMEFLYNGGNYYNSRWGGLSKGRALRVEAIFRQLVMMRFS